MLKLTTALLLAAAALAIAAPARAADPVASCSPNGTTVAVVKGSTFGISVGYGNLSGGDTTYTATMLANIFFGAQHTFDTQSLGSGLGVSKNFDFISTAAFPVGTDHVRIQFTTSTTGATIVGSCDFVLIVGSADTDGDGLFDDWETGGVDVDGGGVDLTLPGASPTRKDLYVEVDCIVAADHSHCPRQLSMQDVVQAFANAPVANPDGTTGVQLHLDTGPLYGVGVVTSVAGTGGVTGTYGDLGGGGSQIAEAGNTIIDWDGATGSPGTSVYTLKAASFNANRALVYRYTIFGHQTNARRPLNDCTSGWAEDIPGNDFIVTLGGLRDTNGDGTGDTNCWSADATGFSVGSRAQQAGTFMHELGHTVGLGHGGGDGVNNKPNYLSVMNYSFQACGVTASGALLPGGCDYSRDDLPDLTETSPPGLDECAGLGDPYGLGPIDWDGDGVFEGASCAPVSANVSVDINGDNICVSRGPNGVLDTAAAAGDVVVGNAITDGGDFDCDTTASGDDVQTKPVGTVQTEPLTGYDDWDNLVYDFRGSPAFANGISDPVEDEPDPESIERAQEQLLEVLAPDLAVSKSGPADATPGDTLTYTLTVHNNGPGPAFDVHLEDAKPSGGGVSFDLGKLAAGATATRTVTFTVPFPIADGATLTDTAVVSGKNLLGGPDEVAANDTATFATTVHTPVLTLAKSGPATALAGAAVPYTLTYANTGSGAAAAVTVTDDVPAGLYVSGMTPPLTWAVGAVAASSGPFALHYTARPSLLLLGGTALANHATLDFSDANGNDYPALAASHTLTVVVTPASGDPRSFGWWRSHPAEATAETRARVQATDQSLDASADGVLSAAELAAALAPGGTPAHVARLQLVAAYLNLATRRLNAGTPVSSRTASRLGLANVRDVVLFARGGGDVAAAIRLLADVNDGKGG